MADKYFVAEAGTFSMWGDSQGMTKAEAERLVSEMVSEDHADLEDIVILKGELVSPRAETMVKF